MNIPSNVCHFLWKLDHHKKTKIMIIENRLQKVDNLYKWTKLTADLDYVGGSGKSSVPAIGFTSNLYEAQKKEIEKKIGTKIDEHGYLFGSNIVLNRNDVEMLIATSKTWNQPYKFAQIHSNLNVNFFFISLIVL